MSDRPTKLVIHAYTDKEFKNPVKGHELFTVPVNPESFTKTFKVELDARTPHGSSGVDPNFKSTGPQELKVEFLFDGTGTIEGYKGDTTDDGESISVHDQLDNFLRCVYNYDGEIHKPHYLIVFWGSEIKFPCVLSNLEVNHTLFDPTGFPIRIKINAGFMGYYTDKSRAAIARMASPDLTHYQKVKQGDRLDLLTYKIYNDPKYFLEVGYVNGLSSIRNVRSGTNLNFPPLTQLDSNA